MQEIPVYGDQQNAATVIPLTDFKVGRACGCDALLLQSFAFKKRRHDCSQAERKVGKSVRRRIAVAPCVHECRVKFLASNASVEIRHGVIVNEENVTVCSCGESMEDIETRFGRSRVTQIFFPSVAAGKRLRNHPDPLSCAESKRHFQENRMFFQHGCCIFPGNSGIQAVRVQHDHIHCRSKLLRNRHHMHGAGQGGSSSGQSFDPHFVFQIERTVTGFVLPIPCEKIRVRGIFPDFLQERTVLRELMNSCSAGRRFQKMKVIFLHEVKTF